MKTFLLVTITTTILGAPFTTMSKIISTAAAQQYSAAATSSPDANSTYYLFTANHEGVNKTKTGIEPDSYSPDSGSGSGSSNGNTATGDLTDIAVDNNEDGKPDFKDGKKNRMTNGYILFRLELRENP